ncbi:NAD(P)/FAD-dependent oxidoreductase [Actinomadura litoris]|uniref:NAD(P)/FAD-dependent oxidoreductase n=1 Tax=Actinomadura litoris TaxID=2678616 RepID=UPI001FA79366|nr:FAD-dependent oxidoreductase [Actinomadura litoris]
MPDVLILGGGFAAVWSAAAATRLLREEGAERSVTVVAPDDHMVIRPRLYQADPGAMRVPLDDVLGPIGVERVRGLATAVHTDRSAVTVRGRDGSVTELSYQRLVLATGSALAKPDLPGAEHLHNVDTVQAAIALDEHLHALPEGPGRRTAVVIGAGFTGLEVATELAGRMRAPGVAGDAADGVRVVLVERADVLGPDLGPGPRPVITSALEELGVEVRLGASVTEVTPNGVVLGDGTSIPASTVVWTAGVQASPLTRDVPAERDRIGRLVTDAYLRVPGVPGVYAAGDTAAAPVEDGNVTMPSCQHATPLGRHAGHNAAADLLGLTPAEFAPDPYVTCLDLGAAGAVFTTGFERTVESTGETAKARKRAVNEEWIYPPVHDAEALLRRADHRLSVRRPVAAG